MAKRTELYEKAQVIFKEEAPWVTVAHSAVFMPMRKKVTGYKVDPLGGHYLLRRGYHRVTGAPRIGVRHGGSLATAGFPRLVFSQTPCSGSS